MQHRFKTTQTGPLVDYFTCLLLLELRGIDKILKCPEML